MQGSYGGQQGYPYGYPNSYFPSTPFPGYAPQTDPYGQPPVWGTTTSMPRPEHIQRQNSTAAPSGFVPIANSTSMPRPKHLSGSRVPGHKAPLKSAMKKGGPVGSVPMQRERTLSDTRSRANSMTRQRSNPRTELVPEYLFVSFHGSSEMRLDNIAFPNVLDEIKEEVLPMWPHGVDSVHGNYPTWIVHFKNGPWSVKGYDGLIARRMISRVFSCLSTHGYSCLTSVNNATRSSRLVFFKVADWEPDRQSHFFAASVTRRGRRLTLIDPPTYVGESLGPSLRNSLPRRIATDRANEDGIYVVELRGSGFGLSGEQETDLFATHAFKELTVAGYILSACVPMARGGLLGFGSRKELWIFKSVARERRESMQRHERERRESIRKRQSN